ncbi:hypothetical protein SeMB42_g02704 [Synchytrium endobioticum]|uniref:F-box domain-containing protein n=1 Tax=Synchytrium endobioticum TaxID=286115 RepID=A0A507DC06_9FUNG|nr:hypothetical protein SeMB42_g02704 [Synchytrium endobioticum]
MLPQPHGAALPPLPRLSFSLWLFVSVILGLPILLLTAATTHIITRTSHLSVLVYARYPIIQHLGTRARNAVSRTASVAFPSLMYGIAVSIIIGLRIADFSLCLARLFCSYAALGFDAIRSRKLLTSCGRSQLAREFTTLSRLGCSLVCRPWFDILWVAMLSFVVRGCMSLTYNKPSPRSDKLYAERAVSRIPPEILDAVLSQLSQWDLVSCCTVNKTWFRVATERINKHCKLSATSFRRIFARNSGCKIDLPCIKTLDLTGSQRLRDVDLFAPFMPYRPQLAGLAITRCVGVYTNQLPTFLSHCRNLTSLTLSKCDATDSSLIALAHAQPPLEHLELSKVLATKEAVVSLLTACSRTLRHVKTAGWGLTVNSHDRILPTLLRLPRLTSMAIWLGTCDWPSLAVPPCFTSTSVTSVHIEGTESITDTAFIAALARTLPHVHTWHVSNCDIRDAAIHAIRHTPVKALILDTTLHVSALATCMPCIPAITALNTLILARCDRVDDAYIALVAAALPRLRRLDVHGCRVTDTGITTVSPLLPNLVLLNVSFCHEISDTSIAALARHNHCLQSLAAVSCHAITPHALATLLQCAPYLSSVEVCHNDYPSFMALRQIVHAGYHACARPVAERAGTQRARSRNGNVPTCPAISRIDLEVLRSRFPRLRVSRMPNEEERWYNDLVSQYVKLSDGGKSQRSFSDLIAQEIANISFHIL